MKNFSLLLSFLLLVSLLGGCSTTNPVFIEQANLKQNMQLKKVSKLAQTQLTYRFANSLISDERKAFFEYLQLNSTQKELSTLFSDAGNASLDIAKASFKYSTAWESALKSGNLGNQIGSSMLIGMGAAILGKYITRRNKNHHNYYIEDKNINALTLEEMTLKYRKKTYQAIYDFAEQYDYAVICDFACKDATHADNSLQSNLFLHDISTKPPTYYRPKYIQIETILQPLISVPKSSDALLLNQTVNYKSIPNFGWTIRLKGMMINNELPFTFPNKTNAVRNLRGDILQGNLIHQLFYNFISKKLPGYSHFFNMLNNNLAFYNGKTYQLNDELTDNSIIKGEWKPPMLPTLTPAQLNPAPTSP